MIGDAIADNMDDLPLLLKPPPHRDHRSRHDLTPVEFEPVGPEDTVGDSGLVFDRYEQDALRGARTLAHKDHAGQIGRAHIRTTVTNAHLVCRLLLEKKKTQQNN